MKCEEVLANWVYFKYKGKTLDSFLSFDKNISYWKLHRFRFIKYLYGIPFRNTDVRYKPIIQNKDDPFFVKIRTKLIYFFISLYLNLIILWYFIKSSLTREQKIKKDNKKRCMFVTHESEIKVKNNGDVVDIYRLEGFRKHLSSKIKEVILVCSPLIKPWKKPKKGHYLLLNDYINLKLFISSLIESYALWKKWKKLDKKTKENAFFYNKKSIYKYLKDDINFIFSFQFIFLNILSYSSIKNVIKKENISIVLTISGIRERCAIAASHKLGIPSVLITHAALVNKAKFFEFYPKTKYFVFNSKDKYLLAKDSNINKNNIFIIGPYLVDKVLTMYKKKKRKDKNKSILVLTQSLYQDYGDIFIEYLDQIFKKLNKTNVMVKIKLHPREKRPDIWINSAKKNLDRFQIILSEHSNTNENILYNSILNSDIVIGFFSNALLDALALNKPVIIIEIEKEKKFFKDVKSIIRIGYKENISKVIDNLLNNQRFREKIKKKITKDISFYYYKLDGNSCKRGANFIEKIIKNEKYKN